MKNMTSVYLQLKNWTRITYIQLQFKWTNISFYDTDRLVKIFMIMKNNNYCKLNNALQIIFSVFTINMNIILLAFRIVERVNQNGEGFPEFFFEMLVSYSNLFLLYVVANRIHFSQILFNLSANKINLFT